MSKCCFLLQLCIRKNHNQSMPEPLTEVFVNHPESLRGDGQYRDMINKVLEPPLSARGI